MLVDQSGPAIWRPVINENIWQAGRQVFFAKGCDPAMKRTKRAPGARSSRGKVGACPTGNFEN